MKVTDLEPYLWVLERVGEDGVRIRHAMADTLEEAQGITLLCPDCLARNRPPPEAHVRRERPLTLHPAELAEHALAQGRKRPAHLRKHNDPTIGVHRLLLLFDRRGVLDSEPGARHTVAGPLERLTLGGTIEAPCGWRGRIVDGAVHHG